MKPLNYKQVFCGLVVAFALGLLAFQGAAALHDAQKRIDTVRTVPGLTAATPSTLPAAAQKSADARFDYKTVKIADQVGSLTVAAVKPYPDQTDFRPGTPDTSVTFTGDLTLSGTFRVEYGIVTYVCSEQLDEASLNLVPYVADDSTVAQSTGRHRLCLTGDLPEREFTGDNSLWTATIHVRGFTWNADYPASLPTDTSMLVETLRKERSR